MSPPDSPDSEESFSLVVITGIRSTGRTLSLRLLEDLGYKGIDNLPPSLIPHVVDNAMREENDEPLVIVPETRSPAAVRELVEAVAELRNRPIVSHVVFLEASESTLMDRIGVLSRAGDGTEESHRIRGDLGEEREVTAELRRISDIVIDTSSLAPAAVKERLVMAIQGRSLLRTMKIELTSFGYKYARFSGDMVFDVRFIPNPYYVGELRPLTGLDDKCAEYVIGFPVARVFVESIVDLVKKLIPAYIDQGRSKLRIGVGCTGGHHRSVAVVEALGKKLDSIAGRVSVRHRELADSQA